MCSATKSDNKETGKDKENAAPTEETVTESIEESKGESSAADGGAVDVKKINNKPKTVGAICKTQKAKQSTIIQNKMLAMLTNNK